MHALEKSAETIFGSPFRTPLHLMTIIRGTMRRTMKDDRQEGEKCLTLRLVGIVKDSLHRFFCRGNFVRTFHVPSLSLPLPPAPARIPNAATCRCRLVALSHDPWRLLSLGSLFASRLTARRKLGLADDGGGGGFAAKGPRDLRSNS